MKKILILVLVLGLVLPFGLQTAFAQTSTSTSITDLQNTISQLLKQIQDKQNQLNTIKQQIEEQTKSLKNQMQTVREEQKNVAVQLYNTLKQGDRGDTVKALQAALAADPGIYPEGLITGFYGQLTAKAVKKFQKKHNLEQVGNIGPKTLKKINEFLKENLLFEEKDDDDEDEDNDREEKRPCAIVPPGHLIAPGWLKKMHGERPIVPVCQNLPEGIWKKLFGATTTTTSTVDTVAPTISSLTATVSSTSAVISFTTNESATAKIYYSTSSPVSTAAPQISSSALIASHSYNLTGLNASTTYYYIVGAKDAASNAATSSQQSFITQ